MRMRTDKIKVLGVLGLTLAAGICFAADSVPAAKVEPAPQPVARPKYEFFEPAKYTGKLGTVTLPYEGTSSLLLRRVQNGKLGDFLVVQGKEQSVQVPVGTYRMMQYTLTVDAAEKGKWVIYGGAQNESKARLMVVKEGGSIRINTGEPLVATIKATQNGGNLALDFKLECSSGSTCTVMRADGKSEPPAFQVLSASGEVLMSGDFAYG